MYLSTSFSTRYTEISMFLSTSFATRYTEISMYLLPSFAKGTRKFPCTFQHLTLFICILPFFLKLGKYIILNCVFCSSKTYILIFCWSFWTIIARHCDFLPCFHCLWQKTTTSVQFMPLPRRHKFALFLK